MSLNLKKIIFPIVVILVLFAYSDAFSTQASAPIISTPQLKVLAEPAAVTATAYAVFDVETGEVLAGKAVEKVLPIASVTKLATAAALVENFDLEKIGEVSALDVATEGRAGKLKEGDSYSYRELIFPLLLESSNDAAAFYERETKGEILVRMNTFTKSLGMKDTVFTDASGLSDQNVSTVSDMVTFLTHLAKKESYLLDITSLGQYVGKNTGWINNSPVITENYQGGKHGYTEAANRTLIALFKEDFTQSQRTVGYVVLGSDNLAADTTALRSFVENDVTFE